MFATLQRVQRPVRAAHPEWPGIPGAEIPQLLQAEGKSARGSALTGIIRVMGSKACNSVTSILCQLGIKFHFDCSASDCRWRRKIPSRRLRIGYWLPQRPTMRILRLQFKRPCVAKIFRPCSIGQHTQLAKQLKTKIKHFLFHESVVVIMGL